MTPERAKKLRDSLNWDYDPDCFCGLCTEYRDGLDSSGFGGASQSEVTVCCNSPEKCNIECVYRDRYEKERAGSPLRADELGPKVQQPDSQKRKATPIFSGVMRYFPDALAAVARLSKAGNDKHNPGEPLHWSRSKSTGHGDCIARHQITFDQIDEETGEYHAVAVAWRALAQLQLLEEAKKAKAEAPVEPEWNVWLPSFNLKPQGRVDVRFRCGSEHKGLSAERWNWYEDGEGTITHWRRAA